MKTQTEEERAIQNSIPQTPQKYELGGDYYYRCHWIACNEQLQKWWEYCPICGQKIDWKGER